LSDHVWEDFGFLLDRDRNTDVYFLLAMVLGDSILTVHIVGRNFMHHEVVVVLLVT
jgi:hypothetical protein